MATTVLKPVIRKLLVQCKTEIITQFNVPEVYIDSTTGSYLKLFIIPEEYTRTIEGDKSSLVNTYTTSLLFPKLIRVGFTTKVAIDDWRVCAALSFLAKSSVSTSYTTYTPITVLDYVRPEIEDFKKVGDSFTERKGLITVDEGTGLVELDQYKYDEEDKLIKEKAPLSNGGFSFKFVEVNKRLII